MLCIVLALTLGLLVPLQARPTPLPLGESQRADMLLAHNAWRERVGVSPLRWSADLAHIAETRALKLASRGCRLAHTKSDLGENLFWASSSRVGDQREMQSVAADEVVDAWGAESRDYSYSRNACARGRKCGHYTQIVWGATDEVGCAAAACADLGQIWVCTYRPAVNIRRQRPY